MKYLTNRVDRALSLIWKLGAGSKHIKLRKGDIVIDDNATFNSNEREAIKEYEDEIKFLLTCRANYYHQVGGKEPDNLFNLPVSAGQKSPKDKVQCINCAHFLKDPAGNGSGIGFCQAYLQGEWAYVKRNCTQYQVINPDAPC